MLPTSFKRTLVHKLHKLKFRFFSKLEKLDGIPLGIRFPLGIFLFALGAVFFYIPFINGIVFMIIGARMVGKGFSNRMFRFIGSAHHKSFSSAREALIYTLKK